ncbi:MAG TPA: hybrid sensor histidine kinase/response regulator [Bacteroidota bacterium]|nr:hybrid sensor histidine kinase/response regulator [Bacteroidota bacterium]
MAEPQYRILIVDDEPDLLDITCAILEMEGYAVSKAMSVRSALELIETITPDVIISDVTMPEYSGFDFFTHVRQNPRLQNTPFIFVSGHSDFAHVKIGKELGSDEYITKPFEPELLLSVIKGKLKRRQQLSESFTQQIEQMKSQLFNIISHEMRTPLTSILGATEVLAEGKDSLSAEDFTEFLEMLKAGSKRLNSMVEDFLLVVRIEAGEVMKSVDRCESLIAPRQLIHRLLQDSEPLIQKKKLQVSIPDDNATLLVAAYLPHLENIIRRVLENAVKFTPAGGTIEVRFIEEDADCTFVVRDSGPGVAREFHQEIFQKFFQINREKHEQQGSGLGLYIAAKLAEANHCQLWIESEPGQGATLFIQIPKLKQ